VTKRVKQFLILSVAATFGLAVGLYAQSAVGAKLARLSEEKAELTKMDVILLNTRIAVLQEMLKDDLSVPLVPTSITYDTESRKIRTSVFVAPSFLSKVNASQLSKSLDSRATSLCIAPSMAEGNLPAVFSLAPKEYCVIRFFTHTLDSSGHVQVKEVAQFEDGKLSLK